MNTFEVEVYIDLKHPDLFRKFFQKECYEPFLRDVMNQFAFFNRDIEIIESQSNGEYDYISRSSGQMYEATLLISPDIVKALFQNKNIWQSPEFAQWIYKECKQNLVDALVKKKNKNSIILFNIFPIRHPRFSGGVFKQFASDGWDMISKEVISENHSLVHEKDVYLISYNHEDNFLLKQLYPRYHVNQFIPFYDKDDVFPLRIKSLKLM